MNRKLAAIAGIAIAAGGMATVVTACGTTTTVVRTVPGPTKTVTHTVRVPVPGPTQTITVTPTPAQSAPAQSAPAQSAPTQSAPTPTQQQSAPAPSPTQQAHAGEVYCTYERMLVAVCTNGGYVMLPASAYTQALAQNPNDPGAVLSGWYPLSEVQG
jgi:hypothetical protein